MRPGTGTYVLGALVLGTLAWVFSVSFLVQSRSTMVLVGFSVALVLVMAGGVMVLRTSAPLPSARLVDVVTAAAATGAALFLCRELAVPQLVSAAIVSTALGVAMLAGGPLDGRSGTAGYSGTFVGVIAPTVTIGWYWILLAGAVAGLLWSLIAPSVMNGVGGRIGTTAFIAAAAVYQFADLLGDRGNAVLLPRADGLAHWIAVPVGGLAAVLTWLLMYRLGWSLPMASGLTSLLVCGGLAIWSPGPVGAVAAATWFGGTAVGRTDATRLPNAGWVALAGLAYGALMLRFRGPLEGHVGIVGAMGLMGCLGIIAARGGLQRLAARLPGKPRVS